MGRGEQGVYRRPPGDPAHLRPSRGPRGRRLPEKRWWNPGRCIFRVRLGRRGESIDASATRDAHGRREGGDARGQTVAGGGVASAGVGLAGVDPLLEAPPDLLARREQVVARAARRELDDADRLVAVAVAARIGGRLVERPQAVSASARSGTVGSTYQRSGAVGTRPGRPGPALCARNRWAEAQLPRLARPRAPVAARARRSTGARPVPARRAVSPWPKSRRSLEPIWNSPRYWPFCARRAGRRTRSARPASASPAVRRRRRGRSPSRGERSSAASRRRRSASRRRAARARRGHGRPCACVARRACRRGDPKLERRLLLEPRVA